MLSVACVEELACLGVTRGGTFCVWGGTFEGAHLGGHILCGGTFLKVSGNLWSG